MQITNLTSNIYELPGLRLHALETVVIGNARYLQDEGFRHLLHILDTNGKVEITDGPAEYPVATALEVELETEGAAASALRVVGPYRVTYADITGLNPMSQGFLLASFDEGTIILDAWAVPITAWNIVDAKLQLSIRSDVDYLALYFAPPQLAAVPNDPAFPSDGTQGPSDGWDAVQNWAFNTGDNLRLPARIRAGGCDFVATLDDHTGTPTAGEIDVYALVNLP